MKKITKDFYTKSILKAQNFIHANMDKSISVDTLAEHVGISKYHFHRIFYGMTGETVQQYARRVRLVRGAYIIMSNNKPIIDVAFESGYETHESFTRAFKSRFGITPNKFRALEKTKALSIISENHINIPQSEVNMDVTLQKFEIMKLVFSRHTGPYKEAGKVWEDLCSYKSLMEQVDEDTLFFGLCYDDPKQVEPSKIRYDACISVKGDFEVPEGLETKLFEGGEYAVHRHLGNYDGLKDKYAWLYGVWLPSSGRELRKEPPMEIYRNSPQFTPEDQLITDICIPLV